MSVSVPAYANACIAPSRSGSAVYLVGVPASQEGRLEAYSINLANINTPTATFLGNQTDSTAWSSTAAKACIPYPGNTANANSPFLLQQFGAKSFLTNVYTNGTMEPWSYFNQTGYVSPKLFSLTGAVGGFDWIVAVANRTSFTTNSPWNALRLNCTGPSLEANLDYVLTTYPTGNPLVSVGTYVAASNTPVQGYHVVFDAAGGGVIYQTLNSASTQTGDRIMTLSNPVDVDMGGIKLTTNVIPVTMVGVAYLLDQASDGSTVLYTITPSASNKLTRVPLTGNVPPFSSSMVATSMNANIVLYGSSSSSGPSAVFNIFDTVSKGWNGPGLVVPPPPPTSVSNPSPSTTSKPSGDNSGSGSKSSSTGGIIGGVVAAVVVIAVAAFLLVRHRRKKNQTPPPAPNKEEGIPQQQNYQPQQQQYNAHQSYYGAPGKDFQTSPVQAQANPAIFQAQNQHGYDPNQSYTYTPPTLSAVSQHGQPQIFRPQSEINSQGGYSQAGYPASSGAVSPQTPYTPSTVVASPQYSHQNQAQYQGYAP
ncbi:hypothetical protein BGZ52_000248 [Haplosporangium bisporale]|nr:hypothetical protein BGZ52_000248 [Haplosporangium bisporale]KAF9212904.1 hypothetical protein BGZ59_006156 [Podila verticillata]